MSNNNVEQGKDMESVSVRLNSIAREIRALKQKALTAIYTVGYILLPQPHQFHTIIEVMNFECCAQSII